MRSLSQDVSGFGVFCDPHLSFSVKIFRLEKQENMMSLPKYMTLQKFCWIPYNKRMTTTTVYWSPKMPSVSLSPWLICKFISRGWKLLKKFAYVLTLFKGVARTGCTQRQSQFCTFTWIEKNRLEAITAKKEEKIVDAAYVFVHLDL